MEWPRRSPEEPLPVKVPVRLGVSRRMSLRLLILLPRKLQSCVLAQSGGFSDDAVSPEEGRAMGGMVKQSHANGCLPFTRGRVPAERRDVQTSERSGAATGKQPEKSSNTLAKTKSILALTASFACLRHFSCRSPACDYLTPCPAAV